MKKFIVLYLLFAHDCLASAPQAWQMLLQTPASPLMEELHEFHNFLLLISGGIVAFIFVLLMYVCLRFNAKANPIPATFSHNILIEVIWTVIPIIILVIIAVPSFRILRFAEKIPEIDMTVKVVGYQWYWHYIYPDHDNIEFDSYLITDENLKPGQKRLLEVDNRIIIPENTTVKFLITAGDVIHSFAVPALGIKIDAVPGRINETWTKISKKGVYYGQCSELCGVNHAFMPIAIEVVSKKEFQNWLIATKTKFSMNKILYGNRPLAKLAYAQGFVGDTSPRTAAYSNVREEQSTGITHKLPAEVEFCKRSIKLVTYLNHQINKSHMVHSNNHYPHIYPKQVKEIVFLKHFIHNPNIMVGDYTYYHDHRYPEHFECNNVVGYHECKLIIGKFCAIAKGTTFIADDVNHPMDGFSTYPFFIFEGWNDYTPTFDKRRSTIVGNDVWFGTNAVIMPGVTIGDGAIIGAYAVVTKDVPPYSIVAGNPSRVIRKRFSDDIINELVQIKWWDWDYDKITRNIKIIVGADIEQLKKVYKS